MIEIAVPGFVAIKMDRISTEERYPSFGINIGIELITFSGKKEIQLNSVWFEQKSWDEFISRLVNFENSGSAIFSDMNEDLKIKITREKKVFIFICRRTKSLQMVSLDFSISAALIETIWR
jgi:hypothetical protein